MGIRPYAHCHERLELGTWDWQWPYCEVSALLTNRRHGPCTTPSRTNPRRLDADAIVQLKSNSNCNLVVGPLPYASETPRDWRERWSQGVQEDIARTTRLGWQIHLERHTVRRAAALRCTEQHSAIDVIFSAIVEVRPRAWVCVVPKSMRVWREVMWALLRRGRGWWWRRWRRSHRPQPQQTNTVRSHW